MDISVYSRPNKPRTMQVTRRQRREQAPLPDPVEVLTLDRRTECHVTPMPVSSRMVEYLGPCGDYPILEPQGGTGNLVAALLEAGYSPQELVILEKNAELCSSMVRRFSSRFQNEPNPIQPVNRCFLDYAKEVTGHIVYPRIITNPPFSDVKAHMKAALSLLGCGGHEFASLVALVPITFNDSEAETLEELPPDTFASVKVYTKIIRYIR